MTNVIRRQIAYAGLFGAALVGAFTGPACALRVGAGGPPPSDPPADSGADARAAPTTIASGDGGFGCAPDGSEQKLPFGAGTNSFAWLWDTDHYVIVYVDPAQGNGGDIYVATLGADGSMRSAPVAVDMTPGASNLPSLVKTSQGYVVVWEEGTAGQSIYVHALGSDASPVGNGVSIGTTQLTDARPVVATAPGGQTAVVWMDQFGGMPGVDFALLNPDPSSFAVTGPQRIPANDQASWPWVAGDSQSLAMLWSDLSTDNDASSPAYEIEFASVDPQTLAPSAASNLPADGPFNQQLGRMVRTSSGYVAAWEDEQSDGGDNQIQMAFLDSNGGVEKNGLVEQPHTGDANWPNIAWSGTYAGIVYYQWRTGLPQIYMTFFDSKGERAAATDMQISDGTTGGARFPDVVWTGSEFGVMYIDSRDGQPELWMHRVRCSG